MIYSPISLENNNKCYEYQDTIILRIYDSINLNQENTYTDYNTQNHYSSKSGSIFLESTPVCISHNDLSDEFYYRNDLSHILIIFLILCLFIIYLPFKIITRFYRRGKR